MSETGRARPSGSSSRPPSGQRVFALHGGDLGVEQFVVHGDLAHLGFQPGDLIVALIALAFLQGRRRAGERSVPPFGQFGHGDIRFTSDQIQRLAAQQARHHRHLALNRITFRSCIDARRGASASYLGALRRPLGLAPFIDRHLKTSGCGSIYRSRMSQLTVTHPTRKTFSTSAALSPRKIYRMAVCAGGLLQPILKALFSFLRWTLMKVQMPRYELAPLTIAKMENSKTCGS